MSPSPVRIALVGSGAIGRRHAEHIAVEPMAIFHAIVDPSPAAKDIAAGYGVPHYESIGAMLAAGRPDAVVIATPNQLHLAHGKEAIAAGIAALVEKPIADSVESGRELVEAAEKAGVPLLVGHHRRHNPLIRKAKSIIEAGQLGRIVSVHGFFWLMKPDDYFDIPWRRQLGAGPVLMNMIHDVDLLRHLCGEIVEVAAYQSRAIRNHPIGEAVERGVGAAEDLLLKRRDGAGHSAREALHHLIEAFRRERDFRVAIGRKGEGEIVAHAFLARGMFERDATGTGWTIRRPA